MPRPGPRPYECVRRAWHSETHQPIRGSLIQDIFRIAHEIHSPGTKKKKEWQEKLPIVVLKVEEIIYSKANSQAEYMDPKTLWDRTNDAINTIIRRDESSEVSGEFLQPCIEAALHLGCVPRRISRSQRNHHPRGYLTGNTDLPITTDGNAISNSSLSPHYSNFLVREPQKFAVPINSCLHNEMHFLSGQSPLPPTGAVPSKSYPVYPLYYGFHPQPKEPQPTVVGLPTSNYAYKKCPKISMSQTLSMCSEEYKMAKRDLVAFSKDQPNTDCDLSLRLGFGPLGTVPRDEIAGLSGSEEKSPCLIVKHKPNENFSFSCGNNVGLGGEFFELGSMVRKRKAVEEMNDPRCSWQPKIMPAYSNRKS
ncbi:uncharacterized protein LOC141605995 isoform X2 [Silene latifolia]|uniref:uncharacterized protein LOC141605995 isoform X2 n=1 Tax=Silene latifolia TaxID=37657 RepID=UPI003D775CF9